jgi:hypothetical protein
LITAKFAPHAQTLLICAVTARPPEMQVPQVEVEYQT